MYLRMSRTGLVQFKYRNIWRGRGFILINYYENIMQSRQTLMSFHAITQSRFSSNCMSRCLARTSHVPDKDEDERYQTEPVQQGGIGP